MSEEDEKKERFIDAFVSPRFTNSLSRESSLIIDNLNNVKSKFRRKSPRKIEEAEKLEFTLRRVLSDVPTDSYLNNIDLYGVKYDIGILKDELEDLKRKYNSIASEVNTHCLCKSNVEIGECLFSGGGSGANIYSCNVDGFICAVKMINRRLIDTELKKQFMNELDILCNVTPHKNIIRYLFTKRIKNNICIFMQKYDGTLAEYITQLSERKQTIDPKTLVFILKSICLGMNHLHNNNIIHRDLKPHNIFLNYKNSTIKTVVIADLDTALIMNKQKPNECIGTTGYIAPEVLNSKGIVTYSHKADVFSFGMLVYHLLTKKPPHHKLKTSYEVTNAILNNTPLQIPENIIKNYSCFIQIYKNCISYDPTDRPNFLNIAGILKQMPSTPNI